MKTKHTPREWMAEQEPFYNYKGKDVRISIRTNGSTLRPSIAFGMSAEEAKANAKLIAAAPELLEALNILYVQLTNKLRTEPTLFDNHENLKRGYKAAKNAIKKATE